MINMKKILIVIAIFLLLVGIALFSVFQWTKNNPAELLRYGLENADVIIDDLGFTPQEQQVARDLAGFAQKLLVEDDVERHYLVLLQNHMELRPGGGFLGQIATISFKDGHVTAWEIRDVNHLDREIKSDILAPAPIEKWLGIKKLNLRDANWQLDFSENVDNIQHLYNLSETPQEFDGMLAVNARLLERVLAITGPVVVPGHEDWGAFDAENGLILLQDVVEKPFLLYEQRQECEKEEELLGIEKVCSIDPETGEKIKKVTHADRENRKVILTDFAIALRDRLFEKLQQGSIVERLETSKQLAQSFISLTEAALGSRDMQLWSRDADVAATITENNWAFDFDDVWEGDYLAFADANLGALKSDFYIKRSLEYTVDFTGSNLEINDAAAGRMVRYLTPAIRTQALNQTYVDSRPLATARMTYEHTATTANYRTSDYHAYTRLYAPRGSEWVVREWFFAPDQSVYRDREVFGYKYDIFIGDTLPTMLQYHLPSTIVEDGYSLKLQKQSGVEDMPVTFTLITSKGPKIQEEFIMDRDAIVTYDAQAQTVSIEKL